MNKLLIYIGENIKFDFETTTSAIISIDGVSRARRGVFIGAVFECNYMFRGDVTVVRLSEDLETVTVEGLGEASFEFSVRFQSAIHFPLHLIDLEYSFDLELSNYTDAQSLMAAAHDSG